MEVIGSISVHGWCDEKLVELSALVANRAAKSQCSASKLLSLSHEVEMNLTHSVWHQRNGGSVCYFKEVATVIFW